MRNEVFYISRGNKDYLIKGTELICDKGKDKSKFEVSEKSVKLKACDIANQTDNIAGKHIKSFGNCSVMGNCKVEADLKGQLFIWLDTYSKVNMCDGEALVEDSYCFCPYGGKITVSDSKQIDYKSAMEELFGNFSEILEQMKDGIEELQDIFSGNV